MKKSTLIIMLGLCLLAQNARAQLLIEEGKIKKDVTPGQTIAESITVHNSTGTGIDVRAYLGDFEYVAPFTGTKKFYPAGTTANSASSWINFEPKEFHLGPYSKRKVNLTVNVPMDVSGGHYSVLFFEKSNPQTLTQGQVGLRIVSRVGSILFFEATNRYKAVALDHISVEGTIFKADLQNKSNVNTVITCFYYILNSDGIPVDRGKLEPYYMPPDGELSFSFPIKKDLSAGKYTAVLTFDLEDGVSSVDEIDLRIGTNGDIQVVDHRN